MRSSPRLVSPFTPSAAISAIVCALPASKSSASSSYTFARSLVAEAKPAVPVDPQSRIVGVMEYRDGRVIDVIRQVVA